MSPEKIIEHEAEHCRARALHIKPARQIHAALAAAALVVIGDIAPLLVVRAEDDREQTND